jgi:hypothetical protein
MFINLQTRNRNNLLVYKRRRRRMGMQYYFPSGGVKKREDQHVVAYIYIYRYKKNWRFLHGSG